MICFTIPSFSQDFIKYENNILSFNKEENGFEKIYFFKLLPNELGLIKSKKCFTDWVISMSNEIDSETSLSELKTLQKRFPNTKNELIYLWQRILIQNIFVSLDLRSFKIVNGSRGNVTLNQDEIEITQYCSVENEYGIRVERKVIYLVNLKTCETKTITY